MSLDATLASIVRKCLRCDFDCGEDVDDPEMQSRLYEEVVYKLETLEDGFRRSQVGMYASRSSFSREFGTRRQNSQDRKTAGVVPESQETPSS